MWTIRSIMRPWTSIRGWAGWRKLWRLVEFTIGLGVVGIFWTTCSEHRNEAQFYATIVKSAYTEALFNKIDAGVAKQHFRAGTGTTVRMTADSSGPLLGNKRTPNEIRVLAQRYIREVHAKNVALELISTSFYRKCALTDAELSDITKKLDSIEATSQEMVTLLQDELRRLGAEIPAREGPREGDLATVCYPK